ncbi:hypothetical protein HHK36_024561 [Tetracentron sinense]|uniref:Uncharacterized protein n=1 Tax=Tetracentron sinense TaxID=13715 RepID=A0A834YLA5_TETSI|nr:hypothetical protein HHK36_024561 [Tetracentron sinense]
MDLQMSSWMREAIVRTPQEQVLEHEMHFVAGEEHNLRDMRESRNNSRNNRIHCTFPAGLSDLCFQGTPIIDDVPVRRILRYGAKPAGRGYADYPSAPPNPLTSSLDPQNCDSEEHLDIVIDDNDGGGTPKTGNAVQEDFNTEFDINIPHQNDTDDEIADVDASDDEADKGPNAAEALRAQGRKPDPATYKGSLNDKNATTLCAATTLLRVDSGWDSSMEYPLLTQDDVSGYSSVFEGLTSGFGTSDDVSGTSEEEVCSNRRKRQCHTPSSPRQGKRKSRISLVTKLVEALINVTRAWLADTDVAVTAPLVGWTFSRENAALDNVRVTTISGQQYRPWDTHSANVMSLLLGNVVI